MNEFNYFALLENKNNKKSAVSKGATITIVIFSILILGLLYGYYWAQGLQYKSQLEYLSKLKNDESLVKAYNETFRVAELVEGAEREASFLEKFSEYLENADTADKRLLDLLDSCLPEGAYYDRIGITGQDISIEGKAFTFYDITALERAYRDCGFFDEILISQITTSGGPESVTLPAEETEEEKAAREAAEAAAAAAGEDGEESEEETVDVRDLLQSFTATLKLKGGALGYEIY